MADIASGEERPRPDPKALTPEYHQAHKQVMLWAAVLLVWELVGVDLEKAQDAGGTVAAAVKALKSPQAVPWVLIILVGYFLFKLAIEWYQCNLLRRTNRVARLDFVSAWVVSVLAYGLYAAQAISRVQIANRIDPEMLWLYVISFVMFTGPLGFCMGYVLWALRLDRRGAKDSGPQLVTALITLIVFSISTVFFLGLKMAVSGLGLGGSLYCAIRWLSDRRKRPGARTLR